MIKIKGLTKRFKSQNGIVEALQDINLEIEKGDVYGIIGLSGAGKSTLIRCINRIETPTEGSLTVNGIDVMGLDDEGLIKLRRGIGMIFQNFNLLSRKTCAENIAFPLKIAKHSKAEIEKRVDELLELVGLQDKKHSYPSQLSGGQKQRVAIARALAENAEILLCDEATSALDPNTTKSILKLLKDINSKLGITIVLITHQMEVIKEVCNKVAVISDGRIVESGDTYDLVTQPKNQITREFFRDSMLDYELPKEYCNENSKLVRITFLENKAYEPVIWEMVSRFGAQVNILGGHIDNVQSRAFGNLIVGIKGNDKTIQESLHYLETEKVHLEVLN